jgi:hypothetical protein
MIEFIPFNEELNRFRLVVRNANSPKLKVTWGGRSRTFTATQLEKGINLAAEFLENPFSAPFQKVENIIKEQQAFEGKAKELFGALEEFQKVTPNDLASIQRLEQAAMDKDRELRDRSRAAVVPINHRISLEATTEEKK